MEDRIEAEVAPPKGSRGICREKLPLEREAERESVGWSMAAPARVENGASKESLNDSSFRWNSHVDHGSPDDCALREEVINHDLSRRV